MTNVNTQSVTTRGMKIIVIGMDGETRTVGLIQQFTIAQTRDTQRVFEINKDSDGDCVEIVPGNLSSITISVQRVELYAQALEAAFGMADPSMLTNQTEPFVLHEIYTKPDGTTYGYAYLGCWFSDMGRDASAEGVRLVTRNATIQVTRVGKV